MIREETSALTAIPNVGKAIEKQLHRLGITQPMELVGKDPYQMYKQLCQLTGTKQDPCVLDVFISAVSYMEGAPVKKWWHYTSERKKKMGHA